MQTPIPIAPIFPRDIRHRLRPEEVSERHQYTHFGHGDLNGIGALLKLAMREGVADRTSHYGLNIELRDAIARVRRAVERLAGQP